MAKSVRSKWKKKMARAKAEAQRPAILEKLSKLNNKLNLVSQNKISTVPMQEPNPNFHFSHPDSDPNRPLKLSKFSTNVRKGLRGHEGNADGSSGVTSAKKRLAQYHPLASQIKAAYDQVNQDAAGLVTSTGGFVNADDDGVVNMMVGGFENDDDDDDNNNNTNEQPRNRQHVLPKAADAKKGGAKKMKSEGPHSRQVKNAPSKNKK